MIVLLMCSCASSEQCWFFFPVVLALAFPRSIPGHSRAQFNLGVMCRDGQGVAQDHDEAFKYFKQSAFQGMAERFFFLFFFFFFFFFSSSSSFFFFFFFFFCFFCFFCFFFFFSFGGYPPAQSNLGYMYENGHGCAKDANVARQLYIDAAKNGDEFAKKKLGTQFFVSYFLILYAFSSTYLLFALLTKRNFFSSLDSKECLLM
jgi:TPR repeat protein